MAKLLRAIKPNAGIRAKYRRRLEAMIDDMNRSVVWWLRAEHRREENRIAQDASPAAALGKRIQTLFRYWMRRWQNKLEDFARDFVHSTERKTRNSIKQALKDAGFTVRMDPARAENDVTAALIRENVALIKSIPEHYFTEVTGLVMRSASRGRDVKFLEDELAKRYAITKRRAKLIARDQSNKATQAVKRVESRQLGITEGIWVHVPGTKSSRKTHMAMNGKRFNLEEGMYDSAVKKKVLPGELVACFPGTSKINGFSVAEKLFRYWYAGELAQVVTDDGRIFSVTPNHPILTLKGWKAAGLLNDCDYVVQIQGDNSGIGKFDQYGLIPTFQEFFDAFILGGVTPSIFDGSTSQFHGDGSNSEVSIIDINSLLGSISDAQIIKKGRELGFSGADMVKITGFFSLLRRSQEFLTSEEPLLFPSFTGRKRELLSAFFRGLSITEKCRIAAMANGDIGTTEMTTNNIPRATKMTGNSIFALSLLIHCDDFLYGNECTVRSILRSWNLNASLPNISAQRIGRDPKLLGYSFDSVPQSYCFNRVINNNRIKFTGHVYNLQTSLGWYITQNTVAHNCNCTYRAVIPEFGD